MADARRFYVLHGRTPKPATAETWSRWMTADPSRVPRVLVSLYAWSSPPARVETNFVGYDPDPQNDPPHLFETVVSRHGRRDIFGSSATYAEALMKHESAVRMVDKEYPP